MHLIGEEIENPDGHGTEVRLSFDKIHQMRSNGSQMVRPHKEHRHTKALMKEEISAHSHNHGHDHGHDHSHVQSKNKKDLHEHDLALSGVLLHVLSDAINNIGVIIAAAVIWKAKYEARFYADPGVSMGISFMILLSCLPLSKFPAVHYYLRVELIFGKVKKSGIMLMGSVPRNIELDDVKHDLEKASPLP